MDPQFLEQQLEVLVEAKIISTPEQNLRRKIDNLIRSIQNLESKRSGIDYELKKAKRSLAQKRMELKKGSKHVRERTQSALQEGVLIPGESVPSPFTSIEDYLLRESARLLDD